MKKILTKIFMYLFLDFVPYMRIGRRKLHLFLLKLYSKNVGENLNFHSTIKTTFGNDIDIGSGSMLGMGGSGMYDW